VTEVGEPPETLEEVFRLETLLRLDARAALRGARDLLDSRDHDADSVIYQRLLLVKGAAQARLGETEDGARVMREVKSWAEDHEDTLLLAATHRQLSGLFRRLGDPALMLEHGVNAVDLLGPDASEAVRADHLMALADALGASGSFTESIARYREAALLSDACGDRYLQVANLNNLGYTQWEAGLVTEAVATVERLLAEVEREGQQLLPHYVDTVARAFMSAGRYDEAARVLAPLVQTPDTGEDADGLVSVLLALAEVHRRAGVFDEAQSALDRSYRLAEEYALTGLMIQILQEQAELYAAQARYKDAFETFRDFHLADVELRAVERDSRARTLNAIFEATEARRSSDYFRELSVRDPLTGLHNRRHLDARLTDLLTGVTRADAHLMLGLIDLDHFKRINDTRSHAVGDEVLRRVAGLLQAAAARVPDGLAVRMGGEEFLVLLPGLSGDAGLERMEEIRSDIADYEWGPVTEDLAVTASIGVAEAPRDGTEERTLLAIADRNLYRAKSAGRDQVQGSADVSVG